MVRGREHDSWQEFKMRYCITKVSIKEVYNVTCYEFIDSQILLSLVWIRFFFSFSSRFLVANLANYQHESLIIYQKVERNMLKEA